MRRKAVDRRRIASRLRRLADGMGAAGASDETKELGRLAARMLGDADGALQDFYQAAEADPGVERELERETQRALGDLADARGRVRVVLRKL